MSQVTPQEAIVLDRENKYLKQTIVSLRDELASKDIGLENLIQQNLASLNAENDSLKESISNLAREQLEGSIIEHEEEKQSILRSNQSEIL